MIAPVPLVMRLLCLGAAISILQFTVLVDARDDIVFLGTPDANGQCSDERWKEAKRVLTICAQYPNFKEEAAPEYHEWFQQAGGFSWFKDHYPDCIEGFLSILFYASYHMPGMNEQLMQVAVDISRELNPLALKNI